MSRVAIVGAGIIGLTIADELVRRGIQVELFERNPSAAGEASSAAAGFLDPCGEADGPGPFLELLKAGYALLPDAFRRLESLTSGRLKLQVPGMLSVAFTDEEAGRLEKQSAWQSQAGFTVERLESQEIRKLEPALDGPVQCGFWRPQVSQIDVTQLGRAYERMVEMQGGIIRRNIPVSRFLVEGSRVVGVETPQGKFHADWVVDSAGAWGGLDPFLPWSVPCVPARGQMLQFVLWEPLVHRIIHSERAYLVQRTPERLIAGTTLEYVGFDKSVTEEGKQAIHRGAGDLCSRLRQIRPETAWAGLRPDTPDHLPILGSTPLEGLLMAVGHFRNGILLAPLTGRLIADLILERGNAFDLAPFQMSRFLAKSPQDAVE